MSNYCEIEGECENMWNDNFVKLEENVRICGMEDGKKSEKLKENVKVWKEITSLRNWKKKVRMIDVISDRLIILM